MKKINNLIYFGDSLTDQGNLSSLTNQVLSVDVPSPASGYESGTFSNGPTYAEYTSALLDVEQTQNFAVASSRAAGVRTVKDFIESNGLNGLLVDNPDEKILNTNINLSAQVDRYLASGPIAKGTAVSLFIGLNDYGNFRPSSPQNAEQEIADLIQAVVSETIAAATKLVAAGAETVILNTLPTSAFFPANQASTPEQQALAAQVIAKHNKALKAAAQSLNAEVKIVDLETLSQEIIEDPETFGFIAPLAESAIVFDKDQDPTNDANPNAAGFDADQIAFFDPLHPTTATHGVIGSFQAASLTHETKFGTKEANKIKGTADKDLIFGRGGDDKIKAGDGEDIVFGGTGNDKVKGGNGNDILSGGAGNDKLKGGSGADVLAGGRGDDILKGNAGDDVIIDGLGSDIAKGGKGDDAFIFVAPSLIGGKDGVDRDFFSGGEGEDTLYLVLDEKSRSLVEDEVSNGNLNALNEIGIYVKGIENVVFVEDHQDLGNIPTPAPIVEADLWGLV